MKRSIELVSAFAAGEPIGAHGFWSLENAR
jgi:hypothetical protein